MQPNGGFEDTRFTVGRCLACDRRVLTYPAYDSDPPAYQCVHCDSVVTEGLDTAPGSALPDHGYGLLELQGCGSPDCGGGQCGRAQSAE